MMSGNFRILATMLLVLSMLNIACAKKSEDSGGGEKPAEDAKPAPSPEASPAASTPPASATGACWDKILKTPEATACSTLYSYSGKVCVAGLTKEATCTREAIAAKYGSANLNGKPVMTSVDEWIAAGYEPNQCAIGTDSKFYVYFLKKVFTSKDANPSGIDQYSIADKRLGPGGAILESIVLQTSTAPTELTCE